MIGPAIIEIKYSFSFKKIPHIIRNLHAQFHELPQHNKNKNVNYLSFENLFLIYGERLSSDHREKVKRYFEARNLGLKLWDLENLLHVMRDNSFEKISSLKELSELALNNAIDKSLKRTSEDRLEKKMKNISETAAAHPRSKLRGIRGAAA